MAWAARRGPAASALPAGQAVPVEWGAAGGLGGAGGVSPECGDGATEPGEACDDGGETATCNADCTLAACGDGVFNRLAEQCELDLHCAVDEVCLRELPV